MVGILLVDYFLFLFIYVKMIFILVKKMNKNYFILNFFGLENIFFLKGINKD